MRCGYWSMRGTCPRSALTALSLVCVSSTNPGTAGVSPALPFARCLLRVTAGETPAVPALAELVETRLRFLDHGLDLCKVVERHRVGRAIANARAQNYRCAALCLAKYGDFEVA